ncbi:unnamed protein product [Rotaria sp. Silwood2]|nr:unnamed protein product [Rotaria sp. Silwood2]
MVEQTITTTGNIHETNKLAGSPMWASIITGIFCAAAAGFLPIDFLAETTSIGTLFAFIMVHLSIIIMHWTHKPQKNADTESDLSDSSETKAREYMNNRITFPSRTLICPVMGILMCLLLMWSTSKWTKVRLVCWIAIGQTVYWLYSRKHSILGNELRTHPDPKTLDPTNVLK